MAKLTLEDVLSGYQSNTTINTNNDLLETLINDQVLFRNNPEGEPNQMLNALDMNSNAIINVGTTSAANSLVTQQDLADLEGNISASPVLNTIADRQIFTSTSDDIAADITHAQGYIRFTGATPASYTVSTGLGLLEGTEIHVRQAGAGVITIVANVGVTINPPATGTLILAGDGATVTLKYVGSEEFDLMGQVFAA